MDQFEKALERARLERRNVVRATANPAATEDAGISRHAPLDATGKFRSVFLDERMLRENRLIGAERNDPTAEAFRILRSKVQRIIKKHNLHAIAITSPRYGDGKSTICLNLALNLALDVNQTVCLVDLDFRKPQVASYLGLKVELGLDDYLLRDVPLADCILKPPMERLILLPIAKAIADSAEVIGLPKMAALANELKGRYPDRIVMYDMPPLLGQVDTHSFLHLVDGVLLVVCEGVTHPKDLQAALTLLEDIPVMGTVLNRSAERGYNRD